MGGKLGFKIRQRPMRGHVQYLCHVDDPHRQGFVAQDGSVLVAFSPLQHYLQSVGVSLQKMRVLWKNKEWGLMNNVEEDVCGGSHSHRPS